MNAIDNLPANLSQRVAYIVNEMKPTLYIEDDGNSASLRLSLRYSSKVNGRDDHHASASGLGGSKQQLRSIEEFMQMKMKQDVFGVGGNPASDTATENVGQHVRLYVPGKVILMHKTVPTAGAEESQYSWSRIEPKELSPILIVDTCIPDHWPSSYENWFEGMGFS